MSIIIGSSTVGVAEGKKSHGNKQNPLTITLEKKPPNFCLYVWIFKETPVFLRVLFAVLRHPAASFVVLLCIIFSNCSTGGVVSTVMGLVFYSSKVLCLR